MSSFFSRSLPLPLFHISKRRIPLKTYCRKFQIARSDKEKGGKGKRRGSKTRKWQKSPKSVRSQGAEVTNVHLHGCNASVLRSRTSVRHAYEHMNMLTLEGENTREHMCEHIHTC
ncbi:hypothetical protein POVWA2_005670 [Plasmodium ovale wallikeri]|uniref:Uncharacterized protein n=1 Tax=Plasmodium ovale wallikeri TaxID=864142 RepID=A0A1A8YJL5_PLAOA|nr:hypothetical protein POVWA1_005570 [Plasmodium ovale wallikeri]SBT31732.1 hypothetical protein POVWA2_005670 [Plasmodium ovale wallikeri]